MFFRLFIPYAGVDAEQTARYSPWRARKTRGVVASRSDMTNLRSDLAISVTICVGTNFTSFLIRVPLREHEEEKG